MTTAAKPKSSFLRDTDHEYLPGGLVRCIPHDFTAKGMPLIRHSLSEHLADTLIRLVLQVGIFMGIGAALAILITHL